MQRLIKGSKNKIFLILDNLKVHHSYKVQAWLENHEAEIRVFFLPSCTPELNPDEYLNCDLKAGVHSALLARDKNQLCQKALSHLRKLQKLPPASHEIFQTSENRLCRLMLTYLIGYDTHYCVNILPGQYGSLPLKAGLFGASRDQSQDTEPASKFLR